MQFGDLGITASESIEKSHGIGEEEGIRFIGRGQQTLQFRERFLDPVRIDVGR